MSALNALGRQGTPEAVAAVIEHADEPAPQVRNIALLASSRNATHEARRKLRRQPPLTPSTGFGRRRSDTPAQTPLVPACTRLPCKSRDVRSPSPMGRRRVCGWRTRSPVATVAATCGCSSMAEFQPSKLAMRVRSPSPALVASGPGQSPSGSACHSAEIRSSGPYRAPWPSTARRRSGPRLRSRWPAPGHDWRAGR
jgi:hypothetical protein